jgi:Protein of unknown function (DUF4231)
MQCNRLSRFETAFALLDLNPVQKSVIQNRFLPLLSHLQSRVNRIASMFHIGRIIITVGSLMVPALLSIQASECIGQSSMYWSTWTTSLAVTTCNALLTLFKLDKKYYYLHTCMEQLISDGWQYIELSGKYSGFNTPEVSPTHSNQFVFFCHAVEKVRMRQVEEEYFKLIETSQGAVAPVRIDNLMPPTPLKENFKQIMAKLIDTPTVNGGRGASDAEVKTGAPPESKTDGAAEPVPMSRIVQTPIAEGRIFL